MTETRINSVTSEVSLDHFLSLQKIGKKKSNRYMGNFSTVVVNELKFYSKVCIILISSSFVSPNSHSLLTKNSKISIYEQSVSCFPIYCL